jgi:hypothetical protein|uniref:Lytic transglycosylase domain-containing protein n=1 Tax=Desulfobacca acetoxidans TaxID=60893 RepID=A0A7C3SKC8_9BACT
MKVVVTIALLLLAFPGLGLTASTKTSDDGSLILAGLDDRPGRTSKESLSVLLAKEIEVFIFRRHTRVWSRSAGLPAAQVPKPELESYIQKYASLHGVDPSLVRAVMRHESGFNPRAVSPKGAQGLMQLMPGTADLMGVANPFDPEQNIAGGVGYLRYCLDRFNNDVALALAAYNAGPERVAKTGGIPPIPETQTYVQNVLSTYTGKTPPTASAKGAHFLTPGTGKNSKILKGSASANSGKSESSEEGKPRRRGPRIIEVRYPSKR